MAVLPMVETCAKQMWALDSTATVASRKHRIANSFRVRISLVRTFCTERTATLLPSARSIIGLRMT